ncbi:MAG TPA: DUF2726 domain-containing protein [Albitalea sp.]|uniref:DUF2726 domain-containing protein n=1 Tax=Piscinibacter sp. TaxID=1903157 RepID=UPI002ED39A8B
MTTTLLVVFLVVALVIVWWALRLRGGRASGSHSSDNLDTLTGWPPQATRVLTTAERQAYDLLRAALPAHMILAQVPLQRFIKVPTRNSYAEWLRRVGQINVDLVICDRHSQVVAVVEIQAEDDLPSSRAHRRRERMMRVLKSAQIPVHLWAAGGLPSAQAAREAILPGDAEPELAVAPTLRSLPGRMPADGQSTEAGELREPPPSTWFDDLESGAVPLQGTSPAKNGKDTKTRPGH